MSKRLKVSPDALEGSQPANESTKGRRAKSRKRPSDCRELFSNLSDYLDGKIEPLACEQMREHIEACPACVAFMHDSRSAIDRCRSLQIQCDSAIAPRLRAILTQEYLRMLGMPSSQNTSMLL